MKCFPRHRILWHFPNLYKIKVTRELSDAVTVYRSYPPTVTTIYRYIPREPSRGMKPLAGQRVIVQYLEAFKQLYEGLRYVRGQIQSYILYSKILQTSQRQLYCVELWY
jgi:hypothetical protein